MRNLLLLLTIGFSCCTSRSEKFTVRQNAIDHIQDLESVKNMIIKNISRLKDSCCQNMHACNDPDSVKATYFFPATYFLLDKYLPESEKSSLRILNKLSPSKMRNSSDNIIISDLRFRPDSTVIFPVADYNISDTLIRHLIIYCPRNNKTRNASEDNVFKIVPIATNWEYYILWSIDPGW